MEGGAQTGWREHRGAAGCITTAVPARLAMVAPGAVPRAGQAATRHTGSQRGGSPRARASPCRRPRRQRATGTLVVLPFPAPARVLPSPFVPSQWTARFLPSAERSAACSRPPFSSFPLLPAPAPATKSPWGRCKDRTEPFQGSGGWIYAKILSE